VQVQCVSGNGLSEICWLRLVFQYSLATVIPALAIQQVYSNRTPDRQSRVFGGLHHRDDDGLGIAVHCACSFGFKWSKKDASAGAEASIMHMQR